MVVVVIHLPWGFLFAVLAILVVVIGGKIVILVGIPGSVIIFKGFKLNFLIVNNLLVTIPSFSE